MSKSPYFFWYKKKKISYIIPEEDAEHLIKSDIVLSSSDRMTLTEKQYAYLNLRYGVASHNDVIEHMATVGIRMSWSMATDE